MHESPGIPHRPSLLAGWLGIAVLFALVAVFPAAAATGKVAGKVVAVESGEPIGFADVALLPADSTQSPVGGLTNADGTFLLAAPPGRYAFRIRALSYAAKRVEDIVVAEGGLLPIDIALTREAIEQQEIVVEAKSRQNTESSLLAARRKAVAMGDAVSAEEVRRSPDKNAADVMRRVTGLSVSDNKYVFVRGLGERYSSTEVDGVRIASPEQNKRVVPLDLVPANLLENIVVQKTYTADGPGEFGGGDVQVHTKDFPGVRSWSLSVSQGASDNVTFKDRLTYPGSRSDLFGFGSDAREIPAAVRDLGGNRKLEDGAVPHETLAAIANSFNPVWSARTAHTMPNAGYVAGFGDEYRVFGHSLGVVQSLSLSRSFDQRDESQRLFRSAGGDTFYNYQVRRSTGSVQLSGISGLSYRISPSHKLHARGFYSNTADDEVRVYEGPDYTRDEAISGGHLWHRDTRLMYLQRSVLSGALEGQHSFPSLLGAGLDWRFSRSRARRRQPDLREVSYDRRYYFEGDTAHWVVGSQGDREYGDLNENGWGTTISASVPYALGGWGRGKVSAGYDRQSKERDNFYRRFQLIHTSDPNQWELPPDTLFGPGNLDRVVENTFTDSRFTDNYRANQLQEAGYLSLDVPFGSSLRGNFGLRVERGRQDVQSFDLFRPDVILQEGRLDDTDWLPSGNVTWAMSQVINLRVAASRTVSRPDLNEMSPSPSLEYQAGALVLGNPNLERARIENYDLRIEAFPGRSELLAAGVFYKNMQGAIEQVIQGSADPLIYPRNSGDGHNRGLELEARTGLGRLWGRLSPLSLNANASIISSDIEIDQVSTSGSKHHPLQGQASYLLNAGINFNARRGGPDVTVLVSSIGKRLTAIGFAPLPDIYEQPSTSLDATGGFVILHGTRVKLSGRNLLDPAIRRLQGPFEVSSFRRGRSFSIALSYDS